MSKFKEGDRVVCVLHEHNGYTYGELKGHQATVVHAERMPYLWVEWDKPCARPNGGYHFEAFAPVECPW